MILVIAVQALRLAAGTNPHAKSGVGNCMVGVGVSGLVIVVVSRLVNEDGEELVDEWVDGPFFAGGLGARDEACSDVFREGIDRRGIYSAGRIA
jgi:hypothetical protein